MLTTRFTTTSAFSHVSNAFSADLQLATRMKEGSCTDADKAKIERLLAGNNDAFFKSSIALRRLLKGVLDGKITDSRIFDKLAEHAACLTQEDQIDLIASRQSAISALSADKISQIAFVFNRLKADQKLALFCLNPNLKSANAREENKAAVISSDTGDNCDARQDENDDGQTISDTATVDSLFSDPDQEFVAFETIASRIVGTATAIWEVCHAFCHQQDIVNDQQLAEAVLYDTCSYTEQQKFDAILASPEERVAFFNDAATQGMIVKAWCDGMLIDPRILDGLQHCTPNLSFVDQDTLARHLSHLCTISSVSSKEITGFFHLFTVLSNEAQGVIAGAINNGSFGTDPAVLQAIAQNLAIFTDPEAQRLIAKAISDGRFGTDATVLQVIAQNLAIFTDPEAQLVIADAIQKGRFGTDATVLQAIAQNLAIFTNPLAQCSIALAIKYGRFGTDPAVLQAIAQNLAIFTDPLAQCSIALAIRYGRFGTDPAVLQAIAQNLAIFTDPEAQLVIAKAMNEGSFGTDAAVLQAIAQNLTIFINSYAQRLIPSAIRDGSFGTDSAMLQAITTIFTNLCAQQEIAQAIRYGRFGTDPTMLQILIKKLTSFNDPQIARQYLAQANKRILRMISPEARLDRLEKLGRPIGLRDQRKIAYAIFNGKFGIDSTILQRVAQNLTIFTDPEAQRLIADAIQKGRFGTDPAVLQAVAQHLRIFTDPQAQRLIAIVIREGNFGTTPAVLQAVAQNLTIFTDPEAQRLIADAIQKGRFGTDPAVLQAIAQNLAIFTDPQAQRLIAIVIREGNFGTTPAVLQAIAQNLAIFTDPEAQQSIAQAINDGRFGTTPAVLQAVAQNLTIFTDPEAQRLIADAIQKGRFGTDPAVLQAIAQNLAIFTDPQAQRLIAIVIREGNFGTTPAVLQAIAQNLAIFTDPEAQQSIAQAINDGRFGTNPNVLNAMLKAVPHLLDTQKILHFLPLSTLSAAEKIEVLSEKKFSLDLSATTLGIPEQDWPKLFGAKAYSDTEIKTLLQARFSNATEDGIDSVCENNREYALQIHDQRLILYPLTSPQDRADFIGWMSQKYGFLYKQCVTKIRIFDFAQLQDGYPVFTQGEDLSPAHTLFASLPAYLQRGVRDNSFDISQFQYADVIRFVTKTLMDPLIAKNTMLVNKMIAIMQSSIVAGGDYIKIAQTDKEDAAIKDEINALCDTEEIRANSITAVTTFLASLTPEVRRTVLPRLAVLLGTMAKKKVLGYYHNNGEINQANTLMYVLASHCFHQLQGTPGIVFPANFHAQLHQGVCIELLTNNFIIANKDSDNFQNVFATR